MQSQRKDRPAETAIGVPESAQSPVGVFDGRAARGLCSLLTRLDLSMLPKSVIVASLFINLLGLALPLVVLQVYDRIIPNQATDTLVVLILGLMGIIGLDVFMKVVRSYVVGWQSTRAACRAHMTAVDNLLTAPRADVCKARHVDWVDQFGALAELNTAGAATSRLVLLDLMFLPIYLLIFALVSGWLMLVPLAVIGPFVWIVFQRGRQLRASVDQRSGQDRRKHDFLIECLNGMQAIKSMAMEPLMQRRYERLQKSAAQASFQVITNSQILQSYGVMMSALTTISVVSIGALMIMAGDLSIGGLACSSLLSGRMMQPVMRAVGVWSEFQNRQVARARVAPLLALSPQFAGTHNPNQCRGAMCLENVRYCDPDTGQPVLERVDLDVRPGEMIGLRTDDSAARAAFMALLRGDIEPTGGTVSVDGRAVRSWGAELSRHLTCVTNRSGIINGTILENLTMFSPQKTGIARKFAMAVGLENHINQMPEGYDTPIGGAVQRVISSGLAQQVAVARSLACQPAIFLFDNANSVLDRASDQAVLETLVSLKGACTMVIACHRPSYLKQADRVFDITNGRLVPIDMLELPGAAPKANASAASSPLQQSA